MNAGVQTAAGRLEVGRHVLGDQLGVRRMIDAAVTQGMKSMFPQLLNFLRCRWRR